MKSVTGGFPASHRLRIKAQFDWVFDRPNQRCSHGVLQAIYKPARIETKSNKISNLTLCHPRLGVIIAKRYLPRAVDRNHLKRLIREGFRSHQSDLPNVDIIVRLLRRPGDAVSAGEVRQLFGKMQRPSHVPDAEIS